MDLKKTFNFLPDGVIILDAVTKKVRFLNKFAKKLFEAPEHDRLRSDPVDPPEQEQRQGEEHKARLESIELNERCLFDPFEDSLIVSDPLEKTRLQERMKQKGNKRIFSLDDFVRLFEDSPEYESSNYSLDEKPNFDLKGNPYSD